MKFEHNLRVYYEDTDLAGIVYYANYLKFTERGRSDAVRAMGIDQIEMKAAGLVFAVRRVEADYLAPARFGDELVVETETSHLGGASMTMTQRVMRGDTLIFRGIFQVVCMSLSGKAARIPADVRQKLQESMQ